MSEKRINILYIGIGSSSGGPIVSLISILRNIDKRKFHPIILVFPNPHEPTIRQIGAINGVTIVNVDFHVNNWLYSREYLSNINIKNYFRSLLRVFRSFRNALLIKKLIRKYSIEIVHTNIELIIDGAIAAKLSGVPHCWHLRAPVGRSGVISNFFGDSVMFKFLAYFSDILIVNSIATRNSIRDLNCLKKTRLIYNGIESELFNKVEESKLRFQNNKSDFLVVSVGYMSQLKGFDNFFEIAKRICKIHDHVKFVWVGPSKERVDHYCKFYFERIHELDLGEKIVFTGEVEDVRNYLNSASLFLQPMEFGSWSRVVMEAMFLSKVIVAIEPYLESETLTHQVNGLIVRGCEDCIDIINEIVLNPKLFEALGKNAKNKAMKSFRIDISVSLLESAYLELVK